MESSPAALQVIADMEATYAAMRSYADTGVVHMYNRDEKEPDEIRFDTAYVRPNHLRFAWVSHHPYRPLRHIEWHSVIWSNHSGAFAWHRHNNEGTSQTREESMPMVIAGATGVSAGAAHTVTNLLLPPSGDFSFRELEKLHIVGIEEIDGVKCHYLFGMHPEFGTHELWVGIDDHLLRKTRDFVGGDPCEQFRRAIRINVDIPIESFVGPPGNS